MTAKPRFRPALAALFVLTAACAPEQQVVEPMAVLPAARWDHRPEAEDWTRATLEALKGEGVALISSTPTDIEQFCPGYAEAGPEKRAAFWVGLLSSIAKYESTWNPAAKGGGGRYLGLMQISPQTAAGAGCPEGLYDGANNLVCAVKIAARWPG